MGQKGEDMTHQGGAFLNTAFKVLFVLADPLRNIDVLNDWVGLGLTAVTERIGKQTFHPHQDCNVDTL